MPEFDFDRAEKAVRELLIAIGEDPDRPGLKETPRRVAKAFEENTGGLHINPADHLEKTFPENHTELVIVRDIPIYSMCEHHLLPSQGCQSSPGLPTAMLVVPRYRNG